MIYQPREDSYLMKEYIEGLNLEGKKCLDMGTGSGIQAQAMLESAAEKVLAADINPEASEKVPEEAEFVESDLFENIDEKFDFMAFNPPYLPKEKEIEKDEIWNGGKNGIKITERFLDESKKYLKSGGSVVIITSSRGSKDKIINKYKLKKIKQSNLWFEELYLMKFRPK
jgi:release factor glutamine methyltransferase